ncbi:cytochrome P450 [Streptomyces phyllanthi]|uniref:Cytochrome P450 n=1 Tax=Streptomyces phyllanthi TaxID=1803180 RepID=A0A5N8VT50_9ACTN|nr:cytochrome P450 [Streptomyces phyllanthi]MPY38417.1 cytochrome P450 [Streptomyces phyllanthi]
MTTGAENATGDIFKDFDHYNPHIGPDGSPSDYIEAIRNQVAAGQRIGRSEMYGGFWVAGGYAECQDILKDTKTFSNKGNIFPKYETGDAILMMAEQDDPDHRKYRQMVAGPFNPMRARALTDQVREHANRLIDRFIGQGEVNVSQGLANELPGQFTAAFLGLPAEDGDMYRDWVEAMARGHLTDPEGAKRKVADMTAYVQNVIDERRRKPGGTDVFSTIIDTEFEGERLTDWELLSFFTILLIGGLENTSRIISGSIWRLSWDLDLRRRLLAKPSLVAGAVEEIMRLYTGPAPCRLVTEDIEFHGIAMKKGDTVMTLSGVANRDPEVFPNPDYLIPDRSPNPHLSLGQGVHRCLGAHLVRVEAKVAVEEFLKRVPEFQLDKREGKEVTWEGGQAAGFTSVPIVFEPQQAAG